MTISLADAKTDYPIKVLQFGGGVFMRGFFNWMLQKMNDRSAYNGSVALVKLTPGGNLDVYEQQQGVFQHIIRGMEEGAVVNRTERIATIAQWIHPYEAWQDYLLQAENPDLQVIISNSTEAGIAYESCEFPESCPASFPAKLCAFLHQRFTKGLGGLWVFPCELIEDNANKLLDILCQHAEDWKLADEFLSWLRSENTFVNTLVDRIVAAPQADERSAIERESGVSDGLLNSSEPYHIFVLGCSDACEKILPFQASDLNIVYTYDLPAYRERKVKLLNGAHTSMLFLSYMRGNRTVEESLNDPLIEQFLNRCLFSEVIPTINLDTSELETFANSVLERFRNPYLKHQLINIALNSISKIRYRILQTILDYNQKYETLPQYLLLGLAAFLCFYKVQKDGDIYRGQIGDEHYELSDNPEHLAAVMHMWQSVDEGVELRSALESLFAQKDIWGADFSQIDSFAVQVAENISALQEKSLEDLLQ
ncbi:MAG: tagaturonate reductase [Planctomycetes bacterium]|nr:tagaturonate reductase [Planctomycetota bacterium]